MLDSARQVARDFLQSVVVVDDRAMMGSEPATSQLPQDAFNDTQVLIPDAAEQRRSRSRGRKPALVPPTPLVQPLGVDEQALDAKVLVDGFAEHGIVCGVIRPTANDAAVERTVKAARRADIVVLDWELNGDGGETSTEVVQQLVREEAEPSIHGRLRLIAIYSGALDLRQIAQHLLTTLSRSKAHVRFRRRGDFAISAGLVRIVVFSKPTSRLTAPGNALKALRRRVITGADLPERLIDEFTTLTTGLVPHVALASLAALRRNTHRVLARLQADLDPAYLWHRATQARPADAEDHLVELVTSELHSILDDENVGSWANIDAIRQWIARDGRADYSSAFGEIASRTPADLEALLVKGAAGKASSNQDVRDKFKKMCVEKRAHASKIAGFAPSVVAAERANERLAALMSLRTRYENPAPTLELGTILSTGRGASKAYWMCVQPRCDSVRLEKESAFPLLPLRTSPADSKFDVLLPIGSSGYKRFRVAKKPSDIRVPHFQVSPPEGDSVIGVKRGKGFAFKAQNGRWYTWVAELKPNHAQRIVQQVANEFSRVGLSESEWLRLWSTKA